MIITGSAIAIYIADKIMSQFIKDEGYGRIKKCLFPDKKYKLRLVKLIAETTAEFESKNPIAEQVDKIPFYKSEVIFDILSNHILFKTEQKIDTAIFEQNPNIIIPTNEQITDFFKIFISKINSDEVLKKLHFDENYKAEIFEISERVKKNETVLTEILNKVNSISIDRSETDLSGVIENITTLRSTNKHKSVIEVLGKFKTDKWSTLSNTLKWKVQINLGLTYFELDEYENAAKCLIDLPNYEHKKNDSIALASLGYALIGDKVNARKKANEAISLDPNLTNAYLTLLLITDVKNATDIKNIIPETLIEGPEMAFTLAAKFVHIREFEEAIKILEKVVAKLPEDNLFKIGLLYLLASAKFSLIENKDFENSKQDKPELTAILDLYIRVWNFYKDTDLRKLNWHVLANIGVLNRSLGNYDIAEANFRESIEIEKQFFTYFSLLQLKVNDTPIAKKLIHEMEQLSLSKDEKCQLLITKSIVLANEQQQQEAIRVLIDNEETVEGSQHHIRYFALLVELLMETNNFPDAKVYIDKSIEKFPNQFIPLYCLIRYKILENDISDISNYLTTARNLLDKTNSHSYMRMAELYANLNDYPAAVNVLEEIADTNSYNPVTIKLLVGYYSAGNYERAVAVAKDLLASNPDEPMLVDYLSNIYETIGDYDSAIGILENILTKRENDTHFKIKLSINYCKKGAFTIAVQILDTIPKVADLPHDLQFFIANAYLESKEYEKGMEIAYQLRQRNYSDAKVHEQYIMLNSQTRQLDDDFHFPNAVGLNSYVVLQSENGNKAEYILVDTKPISPNDVAVSETLGKELLGKHVNDTIGIGGTEYKILSILSKYTYAFRDSLTQISTRFSDQSLAVKVFNIETKTGEYDFKPIFDVIDQGDNYQKHVDQLYRGTIATIGSNSTLLKENPIRYWGKITSSDIGLYSIGPREEYHLAMQELKNGKGMVIDIVGLLTLFHVDAIDKLSKIPNKAYVVSTTIDLVEKQIAALSKDLKEDTMSVSKMGNQYVHNTVTIEQKNKHIENLTHFLAQIREYSVVVTPAISNNHFEKKEKDKVLGEAFYDVGQYALKNNLLMFSDDLKFRSIMRQMHSTQSMSSFIFLQYLLQKDIITSEEYNNNISSMVKMNYRVIPVNADVLFDLFKSSNFRIGYPFVNGCDIIRVDMLGDSSAVKLCINFLYNVYTQTSAFDRGFVCQYIIRKYFVDRDYVPAKRIFTTYLNARFYLLPQQKAEILNFLP